MILGIAFAIAIVGWLLLRSGAPSEPRIERTHGAVPAAVIASLPGGQSVTLQPLVARLRSSGDVYVYLADFRAGCFLDYVAHASGGAAIYQRSICIPVYANSTLRLLHEPDDSGGTLNRHWLTVGTVDAGIEKLRRTFRQCGSKTYTLNAPLLPSDPSRRIFMLDGGSCDWKLAELLTGGSVVARVEQPGRGDA